MNYYNLLLWTITCLSISLILTQATIFHSPREWVKKKSEFFGQLFSCPLCIAFWVGGFLNLTMYPVTPHIFFDACYASGAVWLLYSRPRTSW